MKTKIIAGIGSVLLVAVLFFALKPGSFTKTFDKTMDNMNTYMLEGDMEITKGEGVKKYVVKVGYEKKDKQENFKVSLYDKELNQEQVIIRNKDGVFVVTPSLNQVFKFEGDWPLNSPKPYLLQSMSEIINGENTTIKKEEDGYFISSTVNYPNNSSFKQQEMLFDKKAKIKWLQIFNQDHTSQMKIVFQKVEYNNKFEKDYFNAPTVIDKNVSSNFITDADLPLYPVNVFDSVLLNKSSVDVNGEIRHILEFTGDKNFTIVQTVKTAKEATETVMMPGEVIDAISVVGFYDENQMSVIYQGVEVTIFSNDLGPQEMMNIIESMQAAVMK